MMKRYELIRLASVVSTSAAELEAAMPGLINTRILPECQARNRKICFNHHGRRIARNLHLSHHGSFNCHFVTFPKSLKPRSKQPINQLTSVTRIQFPSSSERAGVRPERLPSLALGPDFSFPGNIFWGSKVGCQTRLEFGYPKSAHKISSQHGLRPQPSVGSPRRHRGTEVSATPRASQQNMFEFTCSVCEGSRKRLSVSVPPW